MANKKVLTSDFINLKAKVKAQMQKRKYVGQQSGSTSVESYGGAAYDYSQAPAADGPILSEYAKKIIEPMRAVNPSGLPDYPGEITEKGMADMNTAVDAWDTRSLTDSSGSDCQSGCTGACYGSCVSGCSGTCSGTCSGCGGNCSGGCYTGCLHSCWAACDNGCNLSCANDCTGTNKGACTICTATCKGRCTADDDGYIG